MKQFLRFYFLNRIVKNPLIAIKIYETMYHKLPFPTTEFNFPQNQSQEFNKVQSINVPSNSNSNELLKTYNYLKTKVNKTKQEKESLGILEAVLKNKQLA